MQNKSKIGGIPAATNRGRRLKSDVGEVSWSNHEETAKESKSFTMAGQDVRQSMLLTSEQLGDLSSQFHSVSSDSISNRVPGCLERQNGVKVVRGSYRLLWEPCFFNMIRVSVTQK